VAQRTGRLIRTDDLPTTMTSPFDRDFGEDPFRRMERLKALRRAGLPVEDTDCRDIEAPIVVGRTE
jgi:hypothetical protein